MARPASAAVFLYTFRWLLVLCGGAWGAADDDASLLALGLAKVAEEAEEGCGVHFGEADAEGMFLLQRAAQFRVPGHAEDQLSQFLSPRPCGEGADCDGDTPAKVAQVWDRQRLAMLLVQQGNALWTAWHRWHRDVFEDRFERLQPEQYLIRVAPLDEWLVLVATVFVLCLIDFLILQRYTGSMKHNLINLAVWVSAGLGYNAYFAFRYGAKEGMDWFTGFLLEWMLSMDNLFVFILIFKVYKTPACLMHKALFFGILGGVLCRVFIYFALGALLHVIHWVRILFGLVLIYSGIQAIGGDDSNEDVTETFAVRALKSAFGSRLMETYDMQGWLFVRGPDGRLCMTLTVFIILCLELTDMFFAVDSVSAKVAQLPNQYVAYSSSVMAIFGLRAMFFVIKDLVDYFDLLKYGLCIILLFVGVELVMSPFLHLESGTVCIVILSVFTVSITASTAKRIIADSSKAPRRFAPDSEDALGARVHDAS